MSWIMTATGRRIDFLRPDVSQITLSDIGIGLSRVARFGGHSPLKVGQHICEVASLMMMRATEMKMSEKEIAEVGLVGLLHDFPEAYCGDIPTPLKRLLGKVYEDIETRLLDATVTRFGLEGLMAKHEDLLKWADRQAVTEEALRYDLDGKYVNEFTGETESVAYQWVDPNVPRYLTNDIWEDEEDRQCAVIMSFLRLMVLSGRGAILTEQNTGIPGTTEDAILTLSDGDVSSDLMPLPPILNNGQVYL